MAKAPACESIMAPDKMKPLLAMSKREPVQAAIGLTSDSEGLLLLDKKAKPRKVLATLRTTAAKAKVPLNVSSLRFGRAEVDPEYDAGTIRLFINKDAPDAMRMKLIEVVKRAGFQRLEFNVDPSLEAELEDEGAETEGADFGAADTQAPQPQAAPEVSQPAPPTPDAANLTAQLRDLIGRIAQAAGEDAARKAALAKLATETGGAIKMGNLPEAAEAMARLRAALDTKADAGAKIAAAASGGTAGAVAYGKARLIWLGTRKKIAEDIAKILQALKADYADEGLGDKISEEFKKRVAPLLAQFDESLADRLDDAMNQTDPGKRAALVEEARLIVGRYQTYLASEPLLPLLDENPYVPIGIVATLTNTLSALSSAIR